MIDQLIDIISKEAALFESFLELLERQKKMLVANNVDGLNEVTALQQEKLTESRVLNRRREQIIARMKELNALEGDVTVSRLLAIDDGNQAVRLSKLRDVLSSLNAKINESRNTNAMLLNQSREFVAKTMAMLAKMNSPVPSYTGKNTPAGSARAVMLDRRV